MKRSKYYFRAIYVGDEFPDEVGNIIDVADDRNEPGYVFRFPDGSEYDNSTMEIGSIYLIQRNTMNNLKTILEAHKKGHISTDEAQQQVLSLFDAVAQKQTDLRAYTKWLRQNDHLQSAPFPPLVKQYLKSL